MTEVLGPALVAGALGRKIGDMCTATMMRGITECRVELLSTRQKAKLPVPAAPNNSAESNSVVDCVGKYDVRLSLSATDQQVPLELPGDVIETTIETATPMVEREKVTTGTTNPESRRIFIISVVKSGDGRQLRDETVNHVDDVPTNPGEIATPVVTYTEVAVCSGENAVTGEEARAVEKTDEDGNTAKVVAKRRLLREIDIATAMHEHLLETNPELTNTISFLDAVYGRTYAPKRGGANEPAVSGTGEMTTTEMPPRTIESLGRAQPSNSKPGFGELASTDKRKGGGDVESDREHETTDVVVLEDTEMSGGETSDNESGSGSSSCGNSYSSGHSRASRKRAADEPLEQEHRRVDDNRSPA